MKPSTILCNTGNKLKRNLNPCHSLHIWMQHYEESQKTGRNTTEKYHFLTPKNSQTKFTPVKQCIYPDSPLHIESRNISNIPTKTSWSPQIRLFVTQSWHCDYCWKGCGMQQMRSFSWPQKMLTWYKLIMTKTWQN